MKAYRGPGAGRPTGIPLPPGRMPPLRRGRMLKRWRYVGVYAADLMLCAGVARIGPARQSWWAVWERDRDRLHERTRLWPGGPVHLDEDRVQVLPLRVNTHTAPIEPLSLLPPMTAVLPSDDSAAEWPNAIGADPPVPVSFVPC